MNQTTTITTRSVRKILQHLRVELTMPTTAWFSVRSRAQPLLQPLLFKPNNRYLQYSLPLLSAAGMFEVANLELCVVLLRTSNFPVPSTCVHDRRFSDSMKLIPLGSRHFTVYVTRQACGSRPQCISVQCSSFEPVSSIGSPCTLTDVICQCNFL